MEELIWHGDRMGAVAESEDGCFQVVGSMFHRFEGTLR